jgi:hypothetical protein
MARALTWLERTIVAALDTDPPATFEELQACTGARARDLHAAIRSLRWRGFIQWGRLALPPRARPEAAPDPDEATGCADDQLFADVPAADAAQPLAAANSMRGVEDLRAALEPRSASPRKVQLQLPPPEPATVFVYPAKPATRTAELAIGAVEPLPAEFRREALIAAKSRQRAYHARLAGKGCAAEQTRREAEKAAADAARLADPLEQAKNRLRSRGYAVFAAEVTGGPKGKFVVGGRLMTEAELLAKAGA